MKRVGTAAAVVVVAAAVGGVVAWRYGLIGPKRKPDGFEDAEAGLVEEYFDEPEGFTQFDDGFDAEVESLLDGGLDSEPDVVPGSGPADAPEPETISDAPTAAEPVQPPLGSHPPLPDGSEPEGFPIKGNADSMVYHEPGTAHYVNTKAEVWFATAVDAEAAGYRKPKGHKKADSQE